MQLRPLIFSALTACTCAALAQAKDPVLIAAGILKYRQGLVVQPAPGETYASIKAKVKLKADKALEGVDPDTVDPKDAYGWAELYVLDGQYKTACKLIPRFLNTHPSPSARFDAEMLQVNVCRQMGDGGKVRECLLEIEPTNESQSQVLVRATMDLYIDMVAKAEGPERACLTLDKMEPKTLSLIGRHTLTSRSKQAAEHRSQAMECDYVVAEARLLTQAGRKAEAEKRLRRFLGTLPNNSRLAPIVRAKLAESR